MNKKIWVCLTLILCMAAHVPGLAAGLSLRAEEQALLSALEILELDVSSEDGLEQTVTRGEAAEYITALLHEQAFAAGKGGVIYFRDMPANSPYSAAVNHLAEKGVIAAETEFRPQTAITFSEFVKLLVCALGYDMYAKQAGGYPNGYLQTAAELKILSGVSATAEEPLTAGAAARLLYNALDVQVLKMELDGRQFTMGDTLLYEKFSVYPVRGIVTANGATTLTQRQAKPADYLEIDHTPYTAARPEMAEYLGYAVRAYVQEDEQETQNQIITLFPASQNQIFKPDETEPVTVADGKLSCTVGGREKTFRIDAYADYIYNHIADPDFLYAENHGEMQYTLVDHDGDGQIEVVKAAAYTNYSVLSVNESETYCMMSQEGAVKQFSEDARLHVYLETGEEIPFLQIPKNSIVSAFESRDGLDVTLRVSTKLVTEQLNGSKRREDRTILTIGRSDYVLATAFAGALNAEEIVLSMGGSYTFMLDFTGKIAAVLADGRTGLRYGYITKLFMDETTETVQLRLFTEEGQFRVIPAKEKILWNGEKTDAAALLEGSTFMQAGKLVRQLVKYDTNGAGELTKLYTAVEQAPEQAEGREGLIYHGQLANARYRWGIFGSAYTVDDDTVFFGIPAPDAQGIYDETKFKIMTAASFVVNDSYTISVYDATKTRKAGAVVSVPQTSVEFYDEYVFLLEDISQVYDEKREEIVTELRGMHRGQAETLRVSGQALQLPEFKPGDMIAYAVDRDGDLLGAKLLFRYGEQDFFESALHEDGSYDRYFYSYGQIVALDGTYVSMTPDGGVTVRPNPYAGAYIYTYDADSGKFDVGAASDMRSPHTGTLNSSSLFVTKKWDVLHDIVIIQ